MQRFMPWSHFGIIHKECTRSTPLDPKLMFSCVLYYMGVFRTVWLPYETRCKMGWVWCNYCKSSSHEVAEFLAMNTPDPPHWTQYSCFVVFRSVWAHLGSFRCFMILGSKQAELLQLMQKFVPQSCVRIFCDKSTRSTPSDPKLVFWCVL